ncbi:DUF6869 domain-containing protein [Ruegeria sp. HKCCSP351]|uniref:DUF6869 domain-containing protein n=1 Tax=Ruegeria sp. HKCCSP351 TaxID=2794832 RepID=UPI001AE4668F|nr:hypothetical protein [Ruegeria sp. HKCCSP351]
MGSGALIRKFVSSWLSFQRNPAGSQRWLESEWVVDARISWAHEKPHVLWSAICDLSKKELSEWDIGMLGSGPLEDLLNEHYTEFSRVVFKEALTNKTLVAALSCVCPPDDFQHEFEIACEKL